MGWMISLAIVLVAIVNREPSMLISAGIFAVAGSISELVAVIKK